MGFGESHRIMRRMQNRDDARARLQTAAEALERIADLATCGGDSEDPDYYFDLLDDAGRIAREALTELRDTTTGSRSLHPGDRVTVNGDTFHLLVNAGGWPLFQRDEPEDVSAHPPMPRPPEDRDKPSRKETP